MDDFKGGLSRVMKEDKFGFVDKNGNEIIPCIYKDVDNFIGGLSSRHSPHAFLFGEDLIF